MERPYLSQELRKLVIDRADRLCEYCLIHSDDTILGCSIDHIISLKHKGPNEAINLAHACIFCNRYKGSDIGSIIWETQEFVRFYNPRRDHWNEHFRLEISTIMPISSIGEVTARILGFNDRNRLIERQVLIDLRTLSTSISPEKNGSVNRSPLGRHEHYGSQRFERRDNFYD